MSALRIRSYKGDDKMKIAIASQENHNRSLINEHFGRCDWFCIYDSKTGKAKYLENPNRYFENEAGVEAVKLLTRYGVAVVIAGRFGSNVAEMFHRENIQMVIPDNERTVLEMIRLLNSQKK